MTNIYRDYYGLPFTKIYWSRLAPIHIDRRTARYLCDCCNKHPMKCDNTKSAKEYEKIQMFMSESDLFGGDVDVPIKETGWCRADLHRDVRAVWKIQRELAYSAGFELRRSSFY